MVRFRNRSITKFQAKMRSEGVSPTRHYCVADFGLNCFTVIVSTDDDNQLGSCSLRQGRRIQRRLLQRTDISK